MALTKKLERLPGKGPHVDSDGNLAPWLINILNDLLSVYYQNDEEIELTTIGLQVSKQDQADVLDDLSTLGEVASDGEIIVGTGAGAFAYESGATARESLDAQQRANVLDDIAAIGQALASGDFIVATGGGAFAYQNGPVTSDNTTGGTGSAGAGNQYVEMVIGGTTYKVLHDGTL